jgi:UDP-glucuronate decarboxylase
MQPHDGRVVSNFIIQALMEQPITVYGDGSQTRSFCYVDDMIDGMCRLMGSPDDFTGPVNLGNPEEITIRELAEKILELTGSPSRILYQPLPWDDPQRRRPDIGLATKRLGWIPQVPIEVGLVKTINYFDSLLREGFPVGGGH